jgi:DNA segregation ATPase FtsK/SpoIIIE-like protein
MSLLITDKTRSGKSTALHRILAHALRQEWAGVIIFDGKGSELHPYAGVDGVCYLSPDQVNRLAVVLQRLNDTLPRRVGDSADGPASLSPACAKALKERPQRE